MVCYNCGSEELRSLSDVMVQCNQCKVVFEPGAYQQTESLPVDDSWNRIVYGIFKLLDFLGF